MSGDYRLEVKADARDVPPGVRAETPLVTLAWRAARTEHQNRLETERTREAQERLQQESLLVAAEETFRIRRTGRALLETGRGAEGQTLLAAAERLEAALARSGITILAPEGEAYTGERMDLLDSVAQKPDEAVEEPRIAEVIAPAVMLRGGLLRAGKAVIAVPREKAAGE
jgi:hypothetical protein